MDFNMYEFNFSIRSVKSDGLMVINDEENPIPVDERAKREVYRMASFEDYKGPIDAVSLATSGFSHIGDQLVMCFSCQTRVKDFTSDDNPYSLKWHQPDCKFILGKECGNVSIGLKPPPKHYDTPLKLEVMPTTWTPEDKHDDNEPKVELIGNIPLNHKSFLLSLNLYKELDRRRSFTSDWPLSGSTEFTDILAKKGFFFVGNGKRTQCFSCHSTLRWIPEDDIDEIHTDASPNCRMLNGDEEMNIPLNAEKERSSSAHLLERIQKRPRLSGAQFNISGHVPQDMTIQMMMSSNIPGTSGLKSREVTSLKAALPSGPISSSVLSSYQPEISDEDLAEYVQKKKQQTEWQYGVLSKKSAYQTHKDPFLVDTLSERSLSRESNEYQFTTRKSSPFIPISPKSTYPPYSTFGSKQVLSPLLSPELTPGDITPTSKPHLYPGGSPVRSSPIRPARFTSPRHSPISRTQGPRSPIHPSTRSPFAVVSPKPKAGSSRSPYVPQSSAENTDENINKLTLGEVGSHTTEARTKPLQTSTAVSAPQKVLQKEFPPKKRQPHLNLLTSGIPKPTAVTSPNLGALMFSERDLQSQFPSTSQPVEPSPETSPNTDDFLQMLDPLRATQSTRERTPTPEPKAPVVPQLDVGDYILEPFKTILTEQFPCNSPARPDMGRIGLRLETFGDSWPYYDSSTTITEVAKAGLFSIGDKDMVKCWYCGAEAMNWSLNLDPWVKHCFISPTCDFLLRNRGGDYVQEVVSNPIWMRANETGSQVVREQTETESSLPAVDAEQFREILLSCLRSDVAKQLVQLGFDRKTIIHQMKERIEKFGRGFESVDEALDDLEDREQDLIDLGLSSSDSDEELTIPEPEVEETPGPSEEQEGASGVGGVGEEARGGEEPGTMSRNEELEVKRELHRLREEKRCKVCLDRDSSMIFIPCGHICSCRICSQALRRCPVCREQIQKSFQTYTS